MYELRSSEFFSGEAFGEDGPQHINVKPIDLQPGLKVSLVRSLSQRSFCATACDDRSCVHFSCLFQGPVHVAYGSHSFCLETGSLMTCYAPGERFRLELPGNFQNIQMEVTPETLASLAGDEYERIRQDIQCGFCILRNKRNRRARDAARRLAKLMKEDQGQRLLIHATALEFLAWNLIAWLPNDRGESVPLRERKMLMAARERLVQDLSNPPTLAELARETGLNQLKLKRGFKIMFGHSVYETFQRERMEHALVLLNNHKVTETAMTLGYSNVSHFSAAFRKQFGILPREARQRGLDCR